MVWLLCQTHSSLEQVLPPGKGLLAPKRDREDLRHISSAQNESVSERGGDVCTCDQATAVWRMNPVMEFGISTKSEHENWMY